MSRKSRSKNKRLDLNLQKFQNYFGFRPSGRGTMKHEMEQHLVNAKIGELHDTSCACIAEIQKIIKPYAEANRSDIWEALPLMRFHYLQVCALDGSLDKIGCQIAAVTTLAKAFGFDVKTARFYGYPDTRASIHKEVDEIIAKLRQQQ